MQVRLDVSTCPEAEYPGESHKWRTVCATGGGLLRQCKRCKEITWTNGRDSFDELKAETELLVSRLIEPKEET